MRVGGPGILRIVDICRRRASDVANGSGEPSATALVGMDGFVVVAQTVADGEHWLLIETRRRDRGARTAAWPVSATAAVG
jgi:hypothetical protein